jgi:hypothetical protein
MEVAAASPEALDCLVLYFWQHHLNCIQLDLRYWWLRCSWFSAHLGLLVFRVRWGRVQGEKEASPLSVIWTTQNSKDKTSSSWKHSITIPLLGSIHLWIWDFFLQESHIPTSSTERESVLLDSKIMGSIRAWVREMLNSSYLWISLEGKSISLPPSFPTKGKSH